MAWLPVEFDGSRSFEEVRRDLITIADGKPSLNHAHVGVRSGDGDWRTATGFIEVQRRETTVHVLLDGKPMFALDESDFVEAHLHTFDGADYYSMDIKLRSGRVAIGDAYNGR